MFYVAPASAGPTYVNVKIPPQCGTWTYMPAKSRNCAVIGDGKKVKARKASFKCDGGGNGKETIVIYFLQCDTLKMSTNDWEFGARKPVHYITVVSVTDLQGWARRRGVVYVDIQDQ